MVLKDTKRQRPLCLFIRRLPHNITEVKLKDIILERVGCIDVEDMIDVSVLHGFPHRGDRPHVPSTAIISLCPEKEGDDNVTKHVVEVVKEIFDGRVVFDGGDDATDAMTSVVEWVPVYFGISAPIRHAAAGKKTKSIAPLKCRTGYIEDDEDYKRFCAGLEKAACEAQFEERGEETQEPGCEPTPEAMPKSLLVQELIAQFGHLKKTKLLKKKMKKKKEKERAEKMKKTTAKEAAKHDKKELLKRSPRQSTQEGNEAAAPEESKAERKKVRRLLRIMKANGGSEALAEVGDTQKEIGVDVEPTKARRRKRQREVKKELRRKGKQWEKETKVAAEAESDRGKASARRRVRKKNRQKIDGEKTGEPNTAEVSRKNSKEGKKEAGEGGQQKKEHTRRKNKMRARNKHRPREEGDGVAMTPH
ncbi:hypothetical protein MOQ_001303 [Trypanosoma cruzi marinkellei]|uniref:Uncharacterized protein n=1 Tax=Trypanosoma cruzi marinkellei TaxID=85056 RepID=K2NGK0_TRYCR|nr:hypothetical protein MOQ_001303 [Trypanosoma cruzi marinkellei]